jgi:hypothetical protein
MDELKIIGAGRVEDSKTSLVLSFNREPTDAELAWESRGREYHDFGSLDGKLQTIQDAAGGLEFRIRDIMYRNPIRCIVSEDMLPSVMDNFRKRVEVFGEIRYSQYGIPLAITVKSIAAMPSDEDLPTAEDVRGILGPATVSGLFS